MGMRDACQKQISNITTITSPKKQNYERKPDDNCNDKGIQ
jgi:hypothetical protein